jgi:hypothetical protein
MSHKGQLALFAFTLGALALLGRGAVAEEIVGPEFGNNRFISEISPVEGGQDTDDYVAEMFAGETVTVTVSAPTGSLLLPAVRLIAPDGTVVPTRNVRRAGGRTVSMRQEVGASGRWAIRISGRDGTTGAYTASFRVTDPKSDVDKNVPIGGAAVTEASVDIEAVDDAILIAAVSWPKTKPAVKFRSLKAPDGATVPVAEGTPILSKTKFRFKAQKLEQGSGTYRLAFGLDSGTGVYTVSWTVRPPVRPTGTTEVDPNEPQFGIADLPIKSAPGQTITLTGEGFSTEPGLRVLFGDVPGTNVNVNPAGTSVTVVVPPGPDGATVPLTIENADGQSFQVPDAFYYIPAPVITGLVDADGKLIRGGSTLGGNARELLGTGFSAGMSLTVNGVSATITALNGPTSLDFTSPAGSSGFGPVVLTDAYGRAATSDFSYSFKAPPALGNPAFTPAFGARFGGTAVSIKGSGFEATDKVLFDGTELPSQVLSSNAMTFTSPYASLGNHTVAVRDRFGTTVTGPAFEVKGPASLTSISYLSGPFLGDDEIPLAGGTLLRLNGSGFRPGDTVTVGGEEATVDELANNALDFVTPECGSGLLSVVVTDAAGQSATLANVLRGVGFLDVSDTRMPEYDEAGTLTGQTAAVGDLDLDGYADELVTSRDSDYSYQSTEYGRTLSTKKGVVRDLTDEVFSTRHVTNRVPYSGPYGTYYYYYYGYRSSSVAVLIGDVESGGDESPQIVMVGDVEEYAGYYGDYTGISRYDVRTFTRNSSGRIFASQYAGGQTQANAYDGKYSYVKYGYRYYYPYGYVYQGYTVYGKNVDAFTSVTPAAGFGSGTSIAIGDIDGDNLNDMVVGTDHYRASLVKVDRSAITVYANSSYYGSYAQYRADGILTYGGYNADGTYEFGSATRVFLASPSGGYYSYDVKAAAAAESRIEDKTYFRMPPVGGPKDEKGARLPAFHAQDVKLGDLDGDGDLDLVVTWPDPTTVTGYGLQNGSGSDDARVATRVLFNDGNGFFSDDTSSWLPGGSSPEFWQGHRCALADLDGDEDLDLILLLRNSTNAYLGKPTYGSHALRILLNEGAGTGFKEATTAALPKIPLAGTRDDNLRGGVLRVHDVNGDGVQDILVGTSEPLLAPDNSTRVRSTRLLVGVGDGTFRDGSAFLPPPATDSGEADDLQFMELTDADQRSLITISLSAPDASTGGRALRAFDWKR